MQVAKHLIADEVVKLKINTLARSVRVTDACVDAMRHVTNIGNTLAGI